VCGCAHTSRTLATASYSFVFPTRDEGCSRMYCSCSPTTLHYTADCLDLLPLLVSDRSAAPVTVSEKPVANKRNTVSSLKHKNSPLTCLLPPTYGFDNLMPVPTSKSAFQLLFGLLNRPVCFIVPFHAAFANRFYLHGSSYTQWSLQLHYRS
jgi:hypothetical protein